MGFFNFFKSAPNVKRALPVSTGLMNSTMKTKQYLDSMAKGGKIKKTGVYKIHKGERVLDKALEHKRK